MFNRKYIFNPGPFSIAMLGKTGVYSVYGMYKGLKTLLGGCVHSLPVQVLQPYPTVRIT